MNQIFFLSPHSDPQANLGEPDSGGQCLYEHQLALALANQGNWRISTFCRQTGKRPDVTEIRDNYTIFRLHCGPEGFVPKEEIDAYLPEFIEKLLPYAKNPENTLLHGHYWDGGKTALYLKSGPAAASPFVWTPHSLGSVKREQYPGWKNEQIFHFIPRLAWENYSCFAADRVVVSSLVEKETVVQDYGVEPGRVQIISPGIDRHDLNSIPKEKARAIHDLPQDGKLILCLGRLTRSKGYHHAIRALAWLKELYPNPVFLVICGGSAQNHTPEEKKYLAELHGITHELHLENEVFFRPAIPHNQVNEMYSAADVFLMASENEPFGLTVLESMAMGLPVVASNTGGPSYLIKHNVTGSLVTIYNPRRVAHYLFSFLRDDEFCRRVTRIAQWFVEREFDWTVQALRFSRLYRQLLESSSRPFPLEVESNFFLQHNITLPRYAALH